MTDCEGVSGTGGWTVADFPAAADCWPVWCWLDGSKVVTSRLSAVGPVWIELAIVGRAADALSCSLYGIIERKNRLLLLERRPEPSILT